ncbi:cytochrome c [Mitsuaria sp. WAJ17]|uniref:SorU family sulfite dehydrogenase c-type cytochrome subunit n=1 Tax=Mitsuaria sp. WAJ17 TaxID=2761452 RepID=UPI0016029179|nr:cytochrome c [Mitsuaria sp. WAJ17]MBB2485954.1 cytochrome c [Mitsuaria sp. WAJ17]
MTRPDPSLRQTLAGLLLPLLAAGFCPAAQAAEDTQTQRGRELFTAKAAPPCATCHTLAAAGSSGEIGPVLDELKPDAARVRRVLQSGLGVMPSYAGKLDAADIEALAQFVSRSAGAVKP